VSILGVAATAPLLSACQKAPVVRASSITEDQRLVVNKDEFLTQDYVLIEHPNHSQPICLLQTNNGDYTASLMSCTHQKCTLAVSEQDFVCPCHGARFSHEGKLLKGPADRDLTSYKTRVTDTTILIDLMSAG